MQNTKRKTIFDCLLIGAALFSMFFGAGNMIFPPYLGFKAGTQWFDGFVGYYVADIGLAIIAIMALIKCGGNKKLFEPLGKVAGTALMFTIVMCIGPIISIPRTAATTYELSVTPLLPNVNAVFFNILFFAVVLLLCINQSAVVDIVGKILTPLLFAGLLFLIINGVVNPISPVTQLPRGGSVIAQGIEAGYQSMDVLGAIIFGVLILNSARQKGHSTLQGQRKITTGASLVAGGGLLVVYLGLTYLGATVSSIYDMHISRTQLLINLINSLMPGTFGMVFFAIVAGLACLSTAIAITSSASEYLTNLTKNKICYKIFVVIICVASAILSCVGVERLVSLASPILNIVYPPVVAMVILRLFDKYITTLTYRTSAIVALVFGVLYTVPYFSLNFAFLNNLPLSKFGLGWVLPTVIFAVAGLLIEKITKKKNSTI